MKLISIGANHFSINKYLVCGIVMLILLYPNVFKDCYYAITFKKTKGIIDSFTFTEYASSRGGKRTSYYPVVFYQVENNTYRCLGSKFQRDGSHVNDSVTVIYNQSNPSKAFVYSFLGFWAPELIYAIPLVLILTLLTSLDIIPYYLTLRIGK
jgi:hypothetical protein